MTRRVSTEPRGEALLHSTLREMCARYLELLDAAREVPRDAARASRLSALANERARLLGRAGAVLPAQGPDAEWVAAALEGAHGEELQRFAHELLRHRGQYPRCYLEAVVRCVVAGRFSEHWLSTASKWHGAVAVLDAMARAAEGGELGYARRDFLTYYVRARRDEDAAAVRAALERLRCATPW